MRIINVHLMSLIKGTLTMDWDWGIAPDVIVIHGWDWKSKKETFSLNH